MTRLVDMSDVIKDIYFEGYIDKPFIEDDGVRVDIGHKNVDGVLVSYVIGRIVNGSVLLTSKLVNEVSILQVFLSIKISEKVTSEAWEGVRRNVYGQEMQRATLIMGRAEGGVVIDRPMIDALRHDIKDCGTNGRFVQKLESELGHFITIGLVIQAGEGDTSYMTMGEFSERNFRNFVERDLDESSLESRRL
jgi:hypothetical protein